MSRPNVEDWYTPEDFNPPNVEWLEITTIGDQYEIQMAVNSPKLYRHRLRQVGSTWIKGNPNDERA